MERKKRMEIGEKLSFLMRLTGTRNSTLGKALSYDASYISRICSGKRGLPKRHPFLEPAAQYFARNIHTEYQKKIASDLILGGEPWPETAEEAAARLYLWLEGDSGAQRESIGRLLSGVSGLGGGKEKLSGILSASAGQAEAPRLSPDSGNVLFFYGNAGKRQGVELFLSEVCEKQSSKCLLLYSGENMSWLYEDREFAVRWAALLIRFISLGGKIKIIHTVRRRVGEMMEAVQKWLPLYASGAIEPYFCPKLRDGVFQQTIFIAQGFSAMIASSVGDETEGMLNLLIHEKEAVSALEKEYENYFRLCRPLVRIYNQQNAEQLWPELSAFEGKRGDRILAQQIPSLPTMPRSVAESMAERSGSRWILRKQEEQRERFFKELEEGGKVTEIMKLPSPEAVCKSLIPIPLHGMFCQPMLTYTPEEFSAHIENQIRLLEEEEGYCLRISDRVMDQIMLMAKEEVGAIISRLAPPFTVFGVSEQSMTTAFWEYLLRLEEEAEPREKTAEHLRAYLRKLEELRSL